MSNTVFSLIADDTRRDILEALRAGNSSDRAESGVSVGELVEELGVSQPTVSKHLKVLREGGLVSVREVGQHRYYSLSPEPLTVVAEWVDSFVATTAGAETTEAVDEAVSDAVDPVFGEDRYTQLALSVGKVGANISHAVDVAVNAVADNVVKPAKGFFATSHIGK